MTSTIDKPSERKVNAFCTVIVVITYPLMCVVAGLYLVGVCVWNGAGMVVECIGNKLRG